MAYPVSIAGFEDQTIEIVPPGLLSSPKLLVNGQPAPRGPGNSQLALRRSDGTEVVATWKPQMLGFDVPQLSVEGKTFSAVPPLSRYEWAWCLFSVIALFFYAVPGVVLAIIVLFYDFKIFHSQMRPGFKYLAVIGLSAAAVGLYALVSTLFNNLGPH